MGLVREGFSKGLFMAYLIPFCGIGLVVVGAILVPRIRNKFSDIFSIGDLVGGEKSHNHKLVRLAIGLSSLMFFGALTVAMSYAGGELVNNVFGFSKIWSIIIVTTVVILYSYFGGIRATIQTDAIQFVHFIILIPILALLVLSDEGFYWNEYMKVTLAKTTTEFNTNPTVAVLGISLLWLFSATGLDAGGFGRFLAAKNNKVARNATIAAGAFLLVWLTSMIFIGSIGYYLYPDLENNDQVLLYIASEHFPGILYGIFIIAMIGVVMSSQDTILNAGSIIFSEDIMGALRPMTEKQKLISAKLYTVLMGVVCIILASYMSSILDVVMVVTEYYIPVMIPVIIFSILKKNCYWQSALISMLVGLISYIVWQHFLSAIMPELFAALILSTLSYLISDYIIIKKIANTV